VIASPRRSRRRLPARARLAVVALVLLVGLLIGGWLWLRDSSLVSVERVSVTGASGPDAPGIASALTGAARRMTTLNVDVSRLRSAVRRYPVVADLRVATHFPHRIQIRVVERIPVGTATINGRQVTISADGMVLGDVPVSASLPTLVGAGRIRDGRLAGWQGEDDVALLGAGPYALVQKLSQVGVDPAHGLTAQFRTGPVVYFGDATELSAKWTALGAVLADPGSAGAGYIDVTDPHRPAAGIGSDGASSTAASTSTTTSSSTSTQGTGAAGTSTSAGTPGLSSTSG
jgi:cell division protein FtsQ